MAFLESLLAHKWTILFYAAVIYLIYHYRAKFDWQAKFLGLYRTKVGLKLMDRMGRHERTFKVLGYIGVFVGFLGMLFILGVLVRGVYELIFVPDALPVVAPVIPGVIIPGVGIKVPLIIGWIALFFVIVIHEFSHGVVARAHKIPVKSSGLMVFGPLGGAFVEPEEKILRKKPKKVQLSVFAAGPFSNLLSAGVLILLLLFAFAPLLGSFVASNGVVFDQVPEGYPAASAGLLPGVVYDQVNNGTINTSSDFLLALEGLAPGDEVLLASSTTGQAVRVQAGEHPEDSAHGYLGVILGINLKNPGLGWLFELLGKLVELITWTFLLSLGIGLANLLPLGPVDGGRMLHVASNHFFGEKQGKYVWARISLFVLVVLVILLIVPIVRSIF